MILDKISSFSMWLRIYLCVHLLNTLVNSDKILVIDLSFWLHFLFIMLLEKLFNWQGEYFSFRSLVYLLSLGNVNFRSIFERSYITYHEIHYLHIKYKFISVRLREPNIRLNLFLDLSI